MNALNALMDYRFDPRTSPSFAPQQDGDGLSTMGSGNGAGWMGWGAVPGMEQFAVAPGNDVSGIGDTTYSARLLDYLDSNGLQLNEDSSGGGATRWVTDAGGNLVGEKQFVDYGDDQFQIAAILASLVAGGAAAGMGGAGSGAGAAVGGAAGGTAGGGLSTMGQLTLADAGIGAGSALGSASAGVPALSTVGGGLAAGGAAAGGSAAAGGTGAAGAANGAAGSSGLGSLFGSGGGGMDWGSLIGNVAGGLIQSNASSSAADKQAAAARDATALQQQMYQDTTARNAPFVQGGTTAFNALLSRLGLAGDPNAAGYGSFGKVPTAADVMAEPGYQFGLDQGNLGLQRQMNMRGMSYSGPALKAAMRFNNDYASGQYNNAFNRSQAAQQQAYNQIGNVANMGQNAANNTGQAGANFASQAGQNMMGAANAGAANSLAQGNIWGNALNQGISQYRNQQQPSYGQYGGAQSSFRADDPYRNPYYFGGGEGE